MQKVLVAEIGSEITVVIAYGDLNAENPRLLGQGVYSQKVIDEDLEIGIKLAVKDLEQNIGPVGSLDEIPFYATSSLVIQRAVQVSDGFSLNGGIMPSHEAIMQATQLIYEEVGDVIVIDVGNSSTNVYSVTSQLMAMQTIEEDLGVTVNAKTLVKLIGENKIEEHHGQGWERLINSKPETPEEIALSAELIAAAVSIALQRHSKRLKQTQLRWIIGTGVGLTQLPNGQDIMRESIQKMESAFFSKEDIAVLLDKDRIMTSLGVLASTFRLGAWQLLRESFGIEN